MSERLTARPSRTRDPLNRKEGSNVQHHLHPHPGPRPSHRTRARRDTSPVRRRRPLLRVRRGPVLGLADDRALFLLYVISATALGLLLLAPLNRLFHRFAGAALEICAAAGFGVAATSLAALLVSEQTPLFGFMESNYRPAILVAIASEAAAALCCVLLLVLSHRARRPVSNPLASTPLGATR